MTVREQLTEEELEGYRLAGEAIQVLERIARDRTYDPELNQRCRDTVRTFDGWYADKYIAEEKAKRWWRFW